MGLSSNIACIVLLLEEVNSEIIHGFEEVNLGRQIWGGGFGEVGSTLVPLSACWQGLLLECRKEARDGSSGDMQGGLFGQLGVGA